MIFYEYPLNERIRTYLRLEYLFLRLTALLARQDALDHHFALTTIFEVMEVGARGDLKSDLLKDLEKEKQTLSSYRGNPAIAQEVLEKVLAKAESCFDAVNATVGKIGQVLTENDWLVSIRSRSAIPGGTCSFDLPAYHAWQHRSAEQRQADLMRWVESLAPIAESIFLMLKLLRDNSSPQKVVATGGQFQLPLAQQGKTFQLLRMALDPALHLCPEISANRLMIHIRIQRQDEEYRLHPLGEDCFFELALCA